jgi:tetratricopeptide (TPR) repeat protein
VRDRQNLLLIGSLVLCGGIRFAYLDYGLPELFEEATPVRRAWDMWNWGGSGFDLNPHFFNYPSFYIYVQWLGQVFYMSLGLVAGWFDTASDMLTAYRLDISPFVLLGRTITVLFSLATVWAVYRLSRALNVSQPVWSALIFGLLPVAASSSRVILVDIPLTLFTTLALVQMTKVVSRPTLRSHVLAGIFIGLATSSKYTAAMLIAPLILANYLGLERRSLVKLVTCPHLWCGALASIGIFAITSPYVLLDYPAFWSDFSYEMLHMAEGHFGRSETSLLYYPGTLAANLGVLLTIATYLGLVSVIQNRRPGWYPVIAFLSLYTMVIHSWSSSFEHYLLPILPILAILGVEGIDLVQKRIGVRFGPQLGIALLCLALVQPSYGSIERIRESTLPTSKAAARRWIEENFEWNATIASERHTVDLSELRYNVAMIPFQTVAPERSRPFYDLRWYAPFDYVMTSSAVANRYLSDPERYPEQQRFYVSLKREWNQVADFPANHRGDPHIGIFKNTIEAQGAAYPSDLFENLTGTDAGLARNFLVVLEQVMRRDGRGGFAAEITGALTKLLPGDRDASMKHAQALMTAGRSEEGLQILKSAMGQDASAAERGAAHYMAGNLDSARTYWEESITQGGDAMTHYNLAMIELQDSKLPKAIGYLEEAVRLGHDRIDTYLQLSQLYYRTNKPGLSVSTITAALRFWPDDIRLHYGLGLTHLRLNDEDGAKHAFQAVLQRQPNHINARNRLGQLAHDAKDYPSAVDIWTQGLRVDSLRIEYYINLGGAQQLSGDLESAIATWQKGLTIAPGNEDLVANLEGAKRLLSH